MGPRDTSGESAGVRKSSSPEDLKGAVGQIGGEPGECRVSDTKVG